MPAVHSHLENPRQCESENVGENTCLGWSRVASGARASPRYLSRFSGLWCASQTGLVSHLALASCHTQNHLHSRTHTRLICTTGAEFQSATLGFPTWWIKFENFDLERGFSFGTLHQWCRKFLSRIFYTFWLLCGWKFRIGTFNPKMGKKSWREILCTTGAEFWRAGVALCTLQSAINHFIKNKVNGGKFIILIIFIINKIFK